jgi:hypothetical protein
MNLTIKLIIGFLILSTTFGAFSNNQSSDESTQETLVELFREWRNFEMPPLKDGAPDYTQATFDRRMPQFLLLQKRLFSIDTSGWTIPQKVDWHILFAEMNGFDFNYRILKPWERDPAYYKTLWMGRSDVPAHEGPTHHAITELWTYQFPLDKKSTEALINDIKVIPALNLQAKKNLVGNAKELWIAGIRDIRTQVDDLKSILTMPGVMGSKDLVKVLKEAISSTESLVVWLDDQAKTKTGPSGIGKENYTWYSKNVRLVPLTWEEEEMILKRELARAWYSLKLEEHKNRNLAPMKLIDNPEEFAQKSREAVKSLLAFLEKEEVVTVKDYFEPALRAQEWSFVSGDRNFFEITTHYDARPLYSHFYHWFELARMDIEPNKDEIRRAPLRYNIFDSRNEGVATGVEEMFMQLGLYEDNPHAREIVYIMIAQRAARGLGSLYAHANEMTMEQAGGVHMEHTPRGWMKTEEALLIFEQHLYLRQPGYGTSYITGKYLMEKCLGEYGKKLEEEGVRFQLKDFMDQLNGIGNIPISLGSWEITGIKPDFN